MQFRWTYSLRPKNQDYKKKKTKMNLIKKTHYSINTVYIYTLFLVFSNFLYFTKNLFPFCPEALSGCGRATAKKKKKTFFWKKLNVIAETPIQRSFLPSTRNTLIAVFEKSGDVVYAVETLYSYLVIPYIQY